MSLYDDYKKENNKQEVSVSEEVYAIEKDPFYKRKEFFILCSTVIAVITIVSILLYTPKFVMEDLRGKNEEYANTYSENYNLKLSVSEEFNEKYSRNQIYSQSLKKGEKYKEGIVLEVKISKGPDFDKKISYPDFSEMSYDEAVKWKKKNFAKGLTISQEASDSYEKGKFIKEDITDENKKTYKRNTESTITYSSGNDVNGGVAKVKDFDGKNLTEVAAWAYKNNLNLIVNEIFDKNITPGVVLSQSVNAGETIAKGTDFVITVCVGEGVVVPNFSSVTKAGAGNLATKSKVNVSERSVYNSNVAAGRLISQSVGAGARIKDTESVELVYSLGAVPISNFEGSGYVDAVSSINTLNESGANIRLNVIYVDRTSPEEKAGTVKENAFANHFVPAGTTIAIFVYR